VARAGALLVGRKDTGQETAGTVGRMAVVMAGEVVVQEVEEVLGLATAVVNLATLLEIVGMVDMVATGIHDVLDQGAQEEGGHIPARYLEAPEGDEAEVDHQEEYHVQYHQEEHRAHLYLQGVPDPQGAPGLQLVLDHQGDLFRVPYRAVEAFPGAP